RTPIQHWFAVQGREAPDHFNQSLLLSAASRVWPRALLAAVSALIDHHDALRMRVVRDDQWIEEQETNVVFTEVDLRLVSHRERSAMIRAVSNAIQRGLHMERGPMLRVALFRSRDDDQLLFAIHHWVVDAFSWRILLEDFKTAYRLAVNGQPILLPAKTISWGQWAAALHVEANRAIREK